MGNSKVLVGFDFSINKPACTIFYRNAYYFFSWPLSVNSETEKAFQKCGVNIYNRGLKSIKKKELSSSELTYVHTVRSKALSDLIVKTILNFFEEHSISRDSEIYVASEGLSFGSKGDATLNLATYKGVLLVKLIESLKVEKLFTFSPISLKSVAGCSCKEKRSDKGAMIQAFIEDGSACSSGLYKAISSGELSKKSGSSFLDTTDDLVDSFWVVKKMIKELELD